MSNEIQETEQKDVMTQYATSRTIKYLFAKFHARYGSKWRSQFPDDLWPLVQSEWLEQLCEMNADDIKRGLDVWAEPWPPNIFEFKDSCKKESTTVSAANKEYVSIAPIKTSREDAQKNLKKLREAVSGVCKPEYGPVKTILKDDSYLKAQSEMNKATREFVDNINSSVK